MDPLPPLPSSLAPPSPPSFLGQRVYCPHLVGKKMGKRHQLGEIILSGDKLDHTLFKLFVFLHSLSICVSLLSLQWGGLTSVVERAEVQEALESIWKWELSKQWGEVVFKCYQSLSLWGRYINVLTAVIFSFSPQGCLNRQIYKKQKP